jgi:trk system potassium uptake protein TrkA
MNVIIIGCSRLGARLATELDRRGESVTIVDVDPTSFRRLGDSFNGETLVGTGIDEDVLMSARIDKCDLFISATNGDNRNIMAAQLAHTTFEVPKVVCRIYDPVRADTYRKLGINTICPTVEMADLVLKAADLEPMVKG